jgi:hypothetical protein
LDLADVAGVGEHGHGGAVAISPSSTCDHSFEHRAEFAAGGRRDELVVALLGETLLDEPDVDGRLVPVRVRLLVLGERHASVVLALLGTPAAATGAAAARVLIGWSRLPAAIAAPLGRGWLRGRAGPRGRLRRDCRRPKVAVQLLADKLDDDLANELGDWLAQLVSE